MPITVRNLPNPNDIFAGTAEPIPERLPEVDDPKKAVSDFFDDVGAYAGFREKQRILDLEAQEGLKKLQDPNTSAEERDRFLDTVIDTECACHAVATSLCYDLRDLYKRSKDETDYIMKPVVDKQFHEAFDNTLRWLMDNMPAHIVVLWARLVLATFRIQVDPKKLSHWDEFADRYQYFILNN